MGGQIRRTPEEIQMTAIHPTTSLDQLRSRITGDVITPDDPGYDAARTGFNLVVDQRPTLIVVPVNTDDVVQAVRYARDSGLGIAIQATGHGVALPADDCLLIHTRRLDEVTIDDDAWTARVGAGVKWAVVLDQAQNHGLAPLLGSSPDVGAVGYTLGGGMGWLARRYGLSADHVRHFEVVTADGEVRKASATENPDLFWALRGGGGGTFGIVTGMEIDLVPVTTVYGGNLLYPATMAREVIARYREWIATAPNELTSSFAVVNLPVNPIVPEFLQGKSFAIVRGCYCGPVADGEALLRFWRDWQAPEIDLFAEMSFRDVAMISMDPVEPVPSMTTSHWLANIDDDLVDIIVRHVLERDPVDPSAILVAEVRHAGGSISAADPASAAYGNRDGQHVFEAVGICPFPEVAAAFANQVAALNADLEPHTTGGTYINFLEQAEKLERTREAFSAEAWPRLQEIKAELDPDNLFRHGFAIPPATR
jgi:FAD/FMN-containing dehydrogenase